MVPRSSARSGAAICDERRSVGTPEWLFCARLIGVCLAAGWQADQDPVDLVGINGFSGSERRSGRDMVGAARRRLLHATPVCFRLPSGQVEFADADANDGHGMDRLDAAACVWGKVMSMARPPLGRALAVIPAPWAAAMARTLGRPRPWPSP